MPRLTVHSAAAPPVTYRFEQDLVTIGRSAAADLVIQDDTLSRVHLELRCAADGWTVCDCESRNGTELNGARLNGPQAIIDGDRLAIGETQLEFFADAGSDAFASDEETATRTRALYGPGELELVGQSKPIVDLTAQIDRIAPSSATVLITGENGTGKELIAKLIHKRSSRASGPFVVVNCPALPGDLLESELLGIESGVATGVQAREGHFEAADGGTLFLDEIGDMGLAAQAKILRVLQEREVVRIGSRTAIPIDVRVVAATHHDLERNIGQDTFRRDLFHRLSVVHLAVPPLRDRRGDIGLLAAHLLSGLSGPIVSLSEEALTLLEGHEFPGNVRELGHLLERARLFSEDGKIDVQHFPTLSDTSGTGSDPVEALLDRSVSFWEAVHEPFLRRHLPAAEARRIVAELHSRCGRSYKALADRLGLSSTEYKKLLNFLRNHDLR